MAHLGCVIVCCISWENELIFGRVENPQGLHPMEFWDLDSPTFSQKDQLINFNLYEAGWKWLTTRGHKSYSSGLLDRLKMYYQINMEKGQLVILHFLDLVS